jgi:hypothetical protein
MRWPHSSTQTIAIRRRSFSGASGDSISKKESGNQLFSTSNQNKANSQLLCRVLTLDLSKTYSRKSSSNNNKKKTFNIKKRL